MRKIDIYDKTFYVTIVIVTVVVAALFINSEKGSFAEPKEPKEPNETQAIAGLGYTDTIKTMPIIEQVHQFGWGKIPKQNNCPHCGKLSFTRFCTKCGKERGDLPFIGVYCPKCNPDGNYASQTSDVTEICGDCGSDRTWKYIYEDWQSEPNASRPTSLSSTTTCHRVRFTSSKR